MRTIIMKQTLAVGASLLLLGLSSCGDSTHLSQTTEVVSTQTNLAITGSTDKIRTISMASDSFFIKVSANNNWQLSLQPSTASEWITLGSTAGTNALDQGVSVSLAQNKGEQREAKIILTASDNTTSEILLIQQGVATTPKPEEQPKPEGSDVVIPAGEHILGDVYLTEIPRLQGGSNMYFVTYKTADNKVNYSLEYDVNKRHSRWVAYTWDKDSAKDVTGRNDSFRWDNIIPSQYSTDNWFSGSGFSRGHLVASNDRQQSVEANRQTFYYSNMSPQRQNHNEGVWLQLETLLQGWARSNTSMYDVLYVTKGGTIADNQIESTKLKGTMVVPKYYWMAVVLKKGNEYHGIGFWTEHSKPSRVSSVSTIAKSIDEIEALTGIDLYPNLENSIEIQVEAEKYTTFRWPGL